MKWRNRLAVAFAVAVLASAVQAESIPDQMVRHLREQGFAQITVKRTWLGRTRIVAVSGNITREIIIDPRTGEILRDLSRSASGAVVIDPFGSGSREDRVRTSLGGDTGDDDPIADTGGEDDDPVDDPSDDPDDSSDDSSDDDSGDDDSGGDGGGNDDEPDDHGNEDNDSGSDDSHQDDD
jgi:hypothetical protein